MKTRFFLAWMLLLAVTMQAQTVSFSASDWASSKGLSDGQQVTDYSQDGVIVTFAQGTAANAAVWNTAQNAIVTRSGNTMTLSVAEGYEITAASFTMKQKSHADNLANNSTWSPTGASARDAVVTWTGNSQTITVTIGGTDLFSHFSITAEEVEIPFVEDESTYNDTTVITVAEIADQAFLGRGDQYEELSYTKEGKQVTIEKGTYCCEMYIDEDVWWNSGISTAVHEGNLITITAPYRIKKIILHDVWGNSDYIFLGSTTKAVIKDANINFNSITVICDETDSSPYTVKFYGLQGELLDAQIVPIGGSATAPVITHECFGGWDKEFSNVHNDLEIHPVPTVGTQIVARDWMSEQYYDFAYTKDGYTVTATYTTSRNYPVWYGDCICFTPGDAFTVTRSEPFKSMTIVCSDEGNASRLAESVCSTGSIVREGNIVYWSGETTTLTFTRPASASGNFDILSFDFPCEYYEKLPCTVIFLDGNGLEIGREVVMTGEAVTPPADPAALEACMQFAHWDTDLNRIMGDTTVRPVFEQVLWLSLTAQAWHTQTDMQPITQNGFTLSTTGGYNNSALRLRRNNTLTIQNPHFIHNLTFECNSIVNAQTLAAQTWSAGQVQQDSIFVYWTGATDSLMIRTETTVEIVSIVSHCQALGNATVTFYDFFGNMLKTEEVPNGGSATAPTFSGECFDGWDQDFSQVYADMNIHPKAVVLFSLTADEWNLLSNKMNQMQTVSKDGYTIVGGVSCSEWDDFRYLNYYGLASQTIKAQQPFNNLTIQTNGQNDATHLANARWSSGEAVADGEYVHWVGYTDSLTFTMRNTNAGVKSFEIDCKTITHYTLIFLDRSGAELTRVVVPAGGSALAPTAPQETGYTFSGWDTDLTNIGGEQPFIHVHPIYEEVDGYINVIFVDLFGNELQRERILAGGSVTAPEAPAVQYHTFTGWDHALTNITENTVIKPLYAFDINNPDILTVTQYRDLYDNHRDELEQNPVRAIKGLYHDTGESVEDGKLTFNLKWQGTYYEEQITVYHMLYLNREPFFSHLDIAEGDTLVVFGTYEPERTYEVINPYTGPEYIYEGRGLKNGYVMWIGAVTTEQGNININLPDAATLYDFSGNGLKQVLYTESSAAYITGDITNDFRLEQPAGTLNGWASFIEDVNHDGHPDVGGSYFSSLLSQGDSYETLEGALFLPHFDANGDGRIDYMIPATNDIMYQMADGTFRKEHMLIYSYDDYMAQFDEVEWAATYMENTYSSNRGIVANVGWTCGVVFSGACLARAPRRANGTNRAPSIGYTLSAITRALDLNADGYIDLIDENNGYLYQNMGNNKWIIMNIGRIVQPADLNNDGFMDYIFPGQELYVLIYKGNGQFDYVNIYSNAAVDDLLYCYDFDHDGDIDILATFSAQHNVTGTAYTCFFLNDGQGHFTRQPEQVYGTENLWFSACQDINGDGYMDLLAFRGDIRHGWDYEFGGTDPIQIVWLQGNANNTFANPETLYTIAKPATGYVSLNGLRINAEDLDNDGKVEIWVSALNGIKSPVFFMTDATANTAPTAPAAPTLLYDNGLLTVSWANGADAHTQAGDLTYGLRIGTTDGGNEILAAHANADGSRRDCLDGNMGRSHTYTIDLSTYAPGTIYVAVQAIDAQHVGSAWSQEATVEHTYIPAEFELSSKTTPFNEAVEVHYTELPAGYIHTWDFDGGVLDGNILTYTTAGDKVITHTVTAPNGKAASYSVTLTVLPNGISTDYLDSDMSKYLLGAWDYNAHSFADFNQDGNMDVLYENVVYQGATPLAYTQATGLWNTQLSAYSFSWLDWNKNGSADLLMINDGGSAYLPHQDNVPDMAYSTVTDNNLDYFYGVYDEVYNRNIALKPDFMHIGQPNIFMFKYDNGEPCYFLIPSGTTYRQVQVTTNGEIDYLKQALSQCTYWNTGYTNVMGVADMNRDGWTDIVIVPYDYVDGVDQYRRMLIFENQGNAQFNQTEVLFTQPIAADDISNAEVRDLNGDGYLDIIAAKSDYRNVYNSRTYILWNNANTTLSEPEVLFTGDITSVSRHYTDLNNDGYQDIIIYREDIANGDKTKGEHVYDWYVWYMGPQGVGLQGFFRNAASSQTRWYDVLPNRLFIDDQQYKDAVYDETYGYLIREGGYEPILREVEVANSNAAPQAPANVRAVAVEDGILIEWDDATDDHTPANKMRYNLSVKHAGQSGAGAYIISPQSGGNALTAYLPSYSYLEANRFLVSKDVLAAGDYEISVQAIDQRNLMSAFSTTVSMHFDRPAIEAPTTVCTGEQAAVIYMGGETGTPNWNLDGGVVVSGTPLGTQYVTWATPGMKTVTLSLNGKSFSRMIYVDTNAADITLPSMLVDGTEVTIPLPANMTAEWSISINGTEATITPRGINGQDEQLTVNDGVLALNTSKTVVSPLTDFPNIYITLELTNANGCTATFTQLVDIVTAAKPEITLVTANADAHYVINWDVSLADVYSQVVVLKETNVLDQFVEVGTANAAMGSFVDLSSDATQKAERYAIRAVLDGGASSPVSPVHQSVHMTINRGMNDLMWNLIWNQYSGADVISYNILRGSSESALVQIASVSAANTSYTDVAVDAQPYYAIEYVLRAPSNAPSYSPQDGPGQTWKRSYSEAVLQSAGRSNIVNSIAARTVTYAQSLTIQSANNTFETTANKPMLLLYAEVLPTNTTYKNVVWEIISGTQLATIDRSSGLLTANKPNPGGTVTVKATTIDGSDQSATKTITIGAIGDDPVVPVYYTIRFLNWDGAVLQTASVREGELPAYSGRTPTRPEDDTYTYTFSGWTPTIVVAASDADYTAQYIATAKPQGIDEVEGQGADCGRLVLIDKVIYILLNGQLYTLTGQHVR